MNEPSHSDGATTAARSLPALDRVASPCARAWAAHLLGDSHRLRAELRALVLQRRDAVTALVAACAGAWTPPAETEPAAPFSRARTARVILDFLTVRISPNAPAFPSFLPPDDTHDALLLATGTEAAEDPVRALRRALSLAGDGAGGAMLPLVVARVELSALADDDRARPYAAWLERHASETDHDWLLARGLRDGARDPALLPLAERYDRALRDDDLVGALDALHAWQGVTDRPLAVCRLFALAFLAEAHTLPPDARLRLWGALRDACDQLPGPLGLALDAAASRRLASLAGAHPDLADDALLHLAPDDRAILHLLRALLDPDRARPPETSDDELLLRTLTSLVELPGPLPPAWAALRALADGPFDGDTPASAPWDDALRAACLAETHPDASPALAAELALWRAECHLGADLDGLEARAEDLELAGQGPQAACLWLAHLWALAQRDPGAAPIPTLAERAVAAARGAAPVHAAALRCLLACDRHDAACALLEIHPLPDPGPGARACIARMLRTFAAGGPAALRRLLALALQSRLSPRDWRSAWADDPDVRTRLLLELDRLASSRDERARELLDAIADERRTLLETLAEAPSEADIDALAAWHRERNGLERFVADLTSLADTLAPRPAAHLLALAAQRLLPSAPDTADRLAAAALARDARHVAANLVRAECAVARDRLDASLPFYEAAGRNERRTHARASIYLRFGDLLRDRLAHVQGATEQYLVAFMCDPGDPDTIERLEAIYLAEARFRELAGLYEVATQHAREQPTDPSALHRLLLRAAQIEFEHLERPERAVGLLEEAVRARPASKRALKLLQGPLAPWTQPATLRQLVDLHESTARALRDVVPQRAQVS